MATRDLEANSVVQERETRLNVFDIQQSEEKYVHDVFLCAMCDCNKLKGVFIYKFYKS